MDQTSESETLSSLERTLERREALTRRLLTALHHLPHERQIAILASWFSLDELEHLVEFQESRERYTG